MKYSKENKSSDFDLESCRNSIISFNDRKDFIVKQFREGQKQGSKTYIREIDDIQIGDRKTKAWSWKESELNIWTGYANEGKTQMLLYMAILKAVKEKWCFGLFTPENYPPDAVFDDMIHTFLGKTTNRDQYGFNMTEEEYMYGFETLKDHFFYVYPNKNQMPEFKIKLIHDAFEYLQFEKGIKSCIVDPYLKIEHEYNVGEQEHQYLSRLLMNMQMFARRTELSYHVVAHQTTPPRVAEGDNYPRPSMYSIKGGGTFADSADNIIILYRPNRKTNPLDPRVMFITEKIKRQKLVGVPYSIEISFDTKKNRFVSLDGYDYFDGSVTPISKQPVYNPHKFPKDSPF